MKAGANSLASSTHSRHAAAAPRIGPRPPPPCGRPRRRYGFRWPIAQRRGFAKGDGGLLLLLGEVVALLAKLVAPSAELILKFNNREAFFIEMNGEFLFLFRERPLPLEQAALHLAQRRLLGRDGGRLDAQRLA